MKKFYGQKQGDFFYLVDSEFLHLKVLRCEIGEQILCLCADGLDYYCTITQINKKDAYAKIDYTEENTKNPKKNIHIFQGLVKGEKLDLIVQKLTELGISEITTFESEFTIAKANNNKLDRLNKISDEACKQCGRGIPLKINQTIGFNMLIEKLKEYDCIFFANEKDTARNYNFDKNTNNIAIVVGSEGGFSDNEINKINEIGCVTFGLGSRILRAETACIALASIVGYMVGV